MKTFGVWDEWSRGRAEDGLRRSGGALLFLPKADHAIHRHSASGFLFLPSSPRAPDPCAADGDGAVHSGMRAGRVRPSRASGRSALSAAGSWASASRWRTSPPAAGTSRPTASGWAGTISIWSRGGPTVAFVEVKTRRSVGCGSPVEAVGWRKRLGCRAGRGGLAAALRSAGRRVRFDLVAMRDRGRRRYRGGARGGRVAVGLK